MKKLNTMEMRNVEGGKKYTCKACRKVCNNWLSFKIHCLVQNAFNAAHKLCYKGYNNFCQYQ